MDQVRTAVIVKICLPYGRMSPFKVMMEMTSLPSQGLSSVVLLLFCVGGSLSFAFTFSLSCACVQQFIGQNCGLGGFFVPVYSGVKIGWKHSPSVDLLYSHMYQANDFINNCFVTLKCCTVLLNKRYLCCNRLSVIIQIQLIA